MWCTKGRAPARFITYLAAVSLTIGACSQGTAPVDEGPNDTTPTVESVSPAIGASNVVVEASLQVAFSEEMSPTATVAAVSMSPGVSCAFSWNAAGDVLTCDPTSNLAYGTVYAITVADSATSAAGVALANSVTSTFTTIQEPAQPQDPAPVVVSTSPQNLATNVPVTSDISVMFSIPMDTASVEAAVAATPAIPCTFVWNGDDTAFTCVLSAPLQSSTAYTVAIGSTVRAANGEALEQPFAISFSTEGAVLPTYYVYGGPGPSFDVYLGCLTCIETSIESVFNDFGTFGEFASPSMDNQFDQYGSLYSNISACNQFATDPPAVFDASGNYYGRLTVNEFVPGRITSTYFLDRLETDICND